jgi:2-polyprenyl-3-methyl-5-hydroxy-6-metoxy-1,4-benzoquinol methylase
MNNKLSGRLAKEAEFQDLYAEAILVDTNFTNRISSFETPLGAPVMLSPRLGKDILKIIGKIERKEVLVLGCGLDPAPIWFSRQKAKVDAIDISLKSVEIQRALAERLGLSVSVFVSDAHNTNLSKSSYHMIYGNRILHHLDTELVAKELSRLLRPDGVAVFPDVIQGNVFLQWFRKLTPFWRTPDEHPLTRRDFAIFKQYFKTIEVSQYILLALPYLFLWRIANAILSKLYIKKRFPKSAIFCRVCDKADEKVFRIFPFMKNNAWACLIVLKKN